MARSTSLSSLLPPLKTASLLPLLFFMLVVQVDLLSATPTAAPFASPAPSPSTDCNTVLLNLLPCIDFVTGQTPSPPANCCMALQNIVHTDPLCLCELFAPNSTFSGINQTLALQLPTACKVQTPPVSTCAALGIPVAAPLAPTPILAVPSPSPSITLPPSASPLAPSTETPVPSASGLSPGTANTSSPTSLPTTPAGGGAGTPLPGFSCGVINTASSLFLYSLAVAVLLYQLRVG